MGNKQKEWYTVAILLEYYGVQIGDCGEDIDGYYKFRFSVPESSTVNSENEEIDKLIKTSSGLMAIAKHYTLECLMSICDKEEEEKYYKSFLNEHVKFLAKVRTGEVWTEEMGKARVEELVKQIKEASEYMEV